MNSAPRHIAVASALSPRFRAVLAEAWRFAQHFDARFSILHAGPPTPDKDAAFRSAIEDLALPPDTPVSCAEGEPATALISLAATHHADLLIAGALERDVERHFLSSVARKLLSELRCSLALFTQPSEDPQPFRRIVIVTDFTEGARDALRLALHTAERDKVEVLHLLSVLTPFATARAGGAGDDEEAKLDEFASFAAGSPVPIDTRVIHSTTGMAVADFTKTVSADLLVVAAGIDSAGRTLLPACMDWITQVIPCNLWVIKSAQRSK